jgi:hypothetical protein
MEPDRVSCYTFLFSTWTNDSIVLALGSQSARPLRLSTLFLLIRGEERGYIDDEDILGTTI